MIVSFSVFVVFIHFYVFSQSNSVSIYFDVFLSFFFLRKNSGKNFRFSFLFAVNKNQCRQHIKYSRPMHYRYVVFSFYTFSQICFTLKKKEKKTTEKSNDFLSRISVLDSDFPWKTFHRNITFFIWVDHSFSLSLSLTLSLFSFRFCFFYSKFFILSICDICLTFIWLSHWMLLNHQYIRQHFHYYFPFKSKANTKKKRKESRTLHFDETIKISRKNRFLILIFQQKEWKECFCNDMPRLHINRKYLPKQ